MTTDIDDVAVERAVCGLPVELNPAEQVEAIRRLAATGHTDRMIAANLPGITVRTIRRRRQQHHIPSTYQGNK